MYTCVEPPFAVADVVGAEAWFTESEGVVNGQCAFDISTINWVRGYWGLLRMCRFAIAMCRPIHRTSTHRKMPKWDDVTGTDGGRPRETAMLRAS